MKDKFLNKVLDNLDGLTFKGFISGNFNEESMIDLMDSKAKNKQLRERLSFVSKDSINLSGVESNAFIQSLAKTEEEETQNRIYIANNYRGFGYKKTIEDFENTMAHILSASIVVKKEEYDNKKVLIEAVQEDMMKAFKNISLTNEEVMASVRKSLSGVEKQFGIGLAEDIAKNSAILITKFRMSVYNIKEGNRESPVKQEVEKLQEKHLSILTAKLKQLNNELPEKEKLELKDIFINLKGRDTLDISFAEKIAKKLDKSTIGLIADIEISGSNFEKHSKELSKINKYERLSSIALNYYLAEKNSIMKGSDLRENKRDKRMSIKDVVSSFDLKASKSFSDMEKVFRNTNNAKSKTKYIDRVYDRVNGDNKLNYNISKEEINEAIGSCSEMFKEYFKDGDSVNSLRSKLSNNISSKFEVNGEKKDYTYMEADVLETVSNVLKDSVFNKILKEKALSGEISEDKKEAYELDVKQNLERGVYNFNKNKNEDLLSCDNMQKIFEMISKKNLSSTEALALLENNRDVLKSFSLEDRYAVHDLVKNISEIKKQEIEKKRSGSPNKEYLFSDLKTKDEDYNPQSSAANFMKRKHIDSILNEGKYGEKRQLVGRVKMLLANKNAILELQSCASKQVESRKMDTQLSMASQCLDTYKNRVDQELKETEKNLTTIATNPALALCGFAAFAAILLVMQKAGASRENIRMLENEREITKIINHIEETNEQKAKDALSILYKLKNHTGSEKLVLSHTTDKESILDMKKDFFYAELLMESKDPVYLNGKAIELADLAGAEKKEVMALKALLELSENPELFNDVTKELEQNKQNQLTNKNLAYNFKQESQNQSIERDLDAKYQSVRKEIDEAIIAYKRAYKEAVPNLKEEIGNARSIADAKSLENIEDVETQKKLRMMLKNISKMQNELGDVKDNLSTTKKKLETLRKERETISPFLDLTNDEGKIDFEKFEKAIKESPDRLITTLNNLDAIKNEPKTLRKKIIFNIVNTAASKNESSLLTPDFFQEVFSKVIPYNRNIIEELSGYDYNTTAHSNDEKVNFEISRKLNESKTYIEKSLDSFKAGASEGIEYVKDKVEKYKSKNPTENNEQDFSNHTR